MDNQFQFFYPIIEETQMDFEGRPHVHEVFCEGHILYNGRPMCGESMEAIMSQAKAKKKKILPKRTPKGLHDECLRKYKECRDSAYYQFVNGQPAKIVSMELITNEAQASA